jgi:hypothetical protein
MAIFAVLSFVLTSGIKAPDSRAEEPTRDNYFVFQSITLGNLNNNKTTGFSTSGSVYVSKTPNSNAVDYELWTKGAVSTKGKKESTYGPVQFSRNPANENISFKTKGFGLTEDVVNQVIAQVEKNPHADGTWNQELSLNLLESYLPGKVSFHFNTQKIQLKQGVQALFIRTYSDAFKIDVIPTDKSVQKSYFWVMYKGALIYSPEDHRLYQAASEFDARKGNETLQTQDTTFLIGPDGKPAYPMLNMPDILDIKKHDKPALPATTPLWVVQALKVQQAVSVASVTAAERASNPAVLPIIAQIVELDGASGVVGLPSSSSLIEAYGKSLGGNPGELAGRFFSTVGSEAIGASGILPETALVAAVPVIAPLLTAYSVYTMYTVAADMTALAFAADLGKLTPFEWPKCAPMDCLAQANAAFDLEKPIEATSEPGPIPEPPSVKHAGKGKLIAGSAIAAGAVLGVAAAGAKKAEAAGGSGGSGSECTTFTRQVNQCHTTSGGVEFMGFLVPERCGNCPNGSHVGGRDTVSSGGPYNQCMCN